MKINPWMFSHHAALYCCSCCVGFPFAVLWWSTVVLWFRSPDTMLSLSSSFTLCLFLSLVLLNTKLLEREVCVLLWWLAAPTNNTCNTDECGEREGWVGLYNIVCTKTPQSNMGPPGQMPTTRWQKLTGKVCWVQFRWDYRKTTTFRRRTVLAFKHHEH